MAYNVYIISMNEGVSIGRGEEMSERNKREELNVITNITNIVFIS